jgi:hypothetical protein
MIHIGRAGTKLGAFSEEEIRQGLITGRFSGTDLGWKEGMANWAPLTEFAELTEPPPLPTVPADVLPEAGATGATPEIETAHAGLPWDERGEKGIVAAFAETVRLVLFSPSRAFARMRTEGSLISPLLFNMIGGWIGLIALGIYGYLTARLHPADLSGFHLPPGFPSNTPAGQQMIALAELKMLIVMGPIFATVAALFCSLMVHLFLMLAGGANNAFHVTLRVFCFCSGSTMLVLLVPFCGSPMALAWLVACCIAGLAAAHKTTTGRAVVAMVLFVVACFACCIGAFALALSAGEQLRSI